MLDDRRELGAQRGREHAVGMVVQRHHAPRIGDVAGRRVLARSRERERSRSQQLTIAGMTVEEAVRRLAGVIGAPEQQQDLDAFGGRASMVGADVAGLVERGERCGMCAAGAFDQREVEPRGLVDLTGGGDGAQHGERFGVAAERMQQRALGGAQLRMVAASRRAAQTGEAGIAAAGLEQRVGEVAAQVEVLRSSHEHAVVFGDARGRVAAHVQHGAEQRSRLVVLRRDGEPRAQRAFGREHLAAGEQTADVGERVARRRSAHRAPLRRPLGIASKTSPTPRPRGSAPVCSRPAASTAITIMSPNSQPLRSTL